MSEQMVVILIVGGIFAVFFYMAHWADQAVREKAQQNLLQSKSAPKDDVRKGGQKAG